MDRVLKQIRWIATLLPAALAGCTVAQPVDVAPEPAPMAAYLAAHHPPDLLVTDSAGRRRWVHRPQVDGDTLRGLPDRGLPHRSLAIPLSQFKGGSLAVPAFSAGRTVGLAVGMLGASAVALIIFVPKPQVVYSPQPLPF